MTELLVQVNGLLDGEGFFSHWRERFRDASAPLGGVVKCRCPFHLSEGFRSFLLDLRRKTFRCTVTQCKAAGGGTFVDLHALLIDRAPLDAVLDLRSTFKCDFPEPTRLALADALAERARALLAEKKFEAAENAAALALRENPTSSGTGLLLGEICALRGRPTDARPYYELAVQEAIDRKDWNQAADLLDRLRSLTAEASTELSDSTELAEVRTSSAECMELAALVAEARCDRAAAAAAYLELGKRPELTADHRRAVLLKAAALDPANVQVLECLASSYEQAGEAAQVLEDLVALLTETGQVDKALEAMDRLTALSPDRIDLQYGRAQLLVSAGRAGEAAQLLAVVADHAKCVGETAQAERCLRELCEIAPDPSERAEAHWRLLELLAEGLPRRSFSEGGIEEATAVAERWLSLASTELSRTSVAVRNERYEAVLKRLKDWHPLWSTYREKLAAYYAERGDIDGGLAERRQLAEMFFARGMNVEALEHIGAMRNLLRGSPRRALEIAQLLLSNNRRREALEEYLRIARASLIPDPALAEEACRAGLGLDEGHAALAEVLLEVQLAASPDKAIEQCRRVVELRRQGGWSLGAVEMVERVKERLPQRVEPCLLLAQLLAEVGQIDRAIAQLEASAGLDLSEAQLGQAISTGEALAERLGERADLLGILAALQRRLAATAREGLPAEALARRSFSEGGSAKAGLVETLLRLASSQRSVGDSDGAEATYIEVFSICPEETRALLGHAELARAERGFVVAKPLYQRYVEQLLSAGRGEEAMRVYWRCVEWAPEDVDIRRALGTLLAERGELEEARTQWEAAATTYLAVHDNPAAAAECYEAIVARCPHDMEARRNLAHLYALAGDVESAVRAVGEAAEQLRAGHDVEGQIELYQSALTHLPGDSSLTRALAVALAAAGRRDEAMATLESLLQTHERSGNHEQARLVLADLVDFEPARTDWRERLAVLLVLSGDTEGAAGHYRILAEQLTAAGQLDAAVSARQWLKEHRPADTENRRALADLHRARKDIEALKADLDELAAVWRHANQPARVLEVVEERLALDPGDLEHRVALAEARQMGGQREAAAADYCQLAEVFYERQESDRARQMIERALQLRPGDAKFRRRLVKYSLREDDPARMIAELANLAEAFFNTGETDEALDCCRQMLKTGRKDTAIQLEAARIYARHRYLEEARETYDRAIKLSERSGEEPLLAALVRALEDFPQAEDLWRRRIALERKMQRLEAAAQSVSGLAGVLRKRGAPVGEIEALYREALEAAELSPPLLNEMADFYLERRQIDEAIKMLHRLARLLAGQDALKAVAVYNRIREFRPEDEAAIEALVRLYEDMGDGETAAEYCLQLAAAHKAQGRWKAARAALETVLESQGPDEQVLSLLIEAARAVGDTDAERRYGQMLTDRLEELGRTDEAIGACEKFLEESPSDWDAYRKLAELYGRRGESAQQAAVLERLARACEKAGETERAMVAREQVKDLDPENAENLVALGQMRVRENRVPEAVAVYRAAFNILGQRGQLERAVEIAERVLTLDDTQDKIRERLAELLGEQGQGPRAAETFSRLGARLLPTDAGRALAAFRSALQFQPKRAADRRRVGELLAGSGSVGAAVSEYVQAARDFASAGEPSRGAECLKAALELEPGNRTAREMLVQMRLEAGEASEVVGEAVAMADRALAEGRTDEAEEILRRAAAAGPEKGQLACERLADLYMRQNRGEEALRELGPLVEMARRQSNLAKICTYLERICELVPIDHEHRMELIELNLPQGNLQKALEHFRRLLPTLGKMGLKGEADRVGQTILAAAGDNWEIKEEVARAYRQVQMNDLAAMTYLDLASSARGRGDYERVADYAASAIGLDSENTGVCEMLLEANLSLGNGKEAFQHARTLSELYDDQDQPEKAVAAARKMTEILPHEPQGYERLSQVLERQDEQQELFAVLDRLAALYVESGDAPKAVETLARYLVIDPDATHIRKRYVELAAQAGQEAELIEDISALITAAVGAGNHEEAERLLQRALKIDPDNLEIGEQWARFLYRRERPAEAHEALGRLIDLLVEHKKIKRAIDLLGELVEEFPRAAPLYSRLGELHLAANAKGHALECFRRAAQLHGQGGEAKAAAAAAEKMLDIDPLDVSMRAALIDSLMAAGQVAQALKHSRILAAQYAERNLLDLAEREFRRIVTHQPDDLGVWQKILDIVERLSEQREHVSDYLLVAELLNRRGLLEEATRAYRKAIQLEPENVEARRAYIEAYLQIGVEKDLVGDYLELADLLLTHGHVEEAVQYYRRVLMIEPDNPQASYQLKRFHPDLSQEKTIQVEAQTQVVGAPAAQARAAVRKRIKPGEEKVLREAVENYRSMLKTKPENAMVRSRLGDVLFQLGEMDEALKEWELASEQFFTRGELEPVIRICERILEIDPSRTAIRERLSRASLKKDSMAAIESAIQSLEDRDFGFDREPRR